MPKILNIEEPKASLWTYLDKTPRCHFSIHLSFFLTSWL